MTRALLALVVLTLIAVPASGADFTASSPTTASFGAAADFNTVAVAITDPGGPLRGTVTLQATASSDRGIDRVRFQSSPAGADTWTDACEDSSAPYSCDWNTAGVADGSRDLRAVAFDQAGYQRTSVIAARMVDNAAPAVALTNPDAWLEGTETLTATGADPHSGLATIAIEYRPAGGGSWTELCSGSASPRSCPLVTTTLADGSYELRARAADAAGNTATSTPVTRRVDNTAPTVAMTDPGAMRGTVTLASTAGDGNGTGVTSVRYEYRQGAGAWTQACTGPTTPFGCSWNTTVRPDGLYDLRAIATDGTGRTTTSATLTGRRIDNTLPSTPTLNYPGTPLQGSPSLSGTASDSSGIVTWVLQYRTAGGGTWTDACSDATASFGCAWATTGVADALYDLRAVARDSAGNERASSIRQNIRVDNNGPAVTFTPPSHLRGTVTLTATATDPAGVQSVVFEARIPGDAWTTACTDTSSPYTCSYDTATIPDGTYELRVRATDTLSRSTTTAAHTITVDNTAPAGADVQSGNGGATPSRLEPGDWVRLTWSEQIAPASVLAGWDGSPIAITAEFENNGGQDELDFYDAAGNVRLNLVASGSDLQLRTNYVASNGEFDATMTQNGASITITLGAQRSGSLNNASAATMRWRPSAFARDLAGNASSTTQIYEGGAADRDF